jgi:predicted nucleic acid-binding protein
MFILDTNVISELRKVRTEKADPRVVEWTKSIDTADLFLSAISIYELEKGILLRERKDPPQGAIFRAWLNGQVLPAFDGRILPVDTAVAQRGAQLSVPDPRPLHDGLIAATALVHGMTVVTRNVADFAPTGARVLDPWSA